MHHFALLEILALGLCLALILGFLTQRLKLSPIVGYLLAGYIVGPNSPGYVADAAMAAQLAEVGVILLMFGVGLHFNLGDLAAVRHVALPGAIIQSAVATVLGMGVAVAFGYPWSSGMVLGLGLAVASTVVLMRVLMDRQQLETVAGHTAVGWLIVEDILTVLVLVILPALATALVPGGAEGPNLGMAILWAGLKLVVLWILIMPVGGRFLPWAIGKVARTRSKELLTLMILASAFSIAVGSSIFFGASVALGAFLAGMVVGKTKISHQAAAELLPMRDAFAVLFFISVGMLFDPRFVISHPGFILGCLAVVLIAKPLAAMAVVVVLGRGPRTGLTVALGLAQIGEFSFILAQQAIQHGLLNEEAYQALVACALISISLNPLLFGLLQPIENRLRAYPRLWAWVDRRATAPTSAPTAHTPAPRAIVVGFGPVGRRVTALLRAIHCEPMIIDLNLDTVEQLTREGRTAVFGDASQPALLESAGIRHAEYLLVTLPDHESLVAIVLAARRLNSAIKIHVRCRFVDSAETLSALGVDAVANEEEAVAEVLTEKLRASINTPHSVQS